MSPSWTSKSRPRVIGVGALPLQNEADVSTYPSGRISERMICEELPIFLTDIAHIPHIRQNHSTFPSVTKENNLKKVISTEMPGVRVSFNVFITFLKLKTNKIFLMQSGSR